MDDDLLRYKFLNRWDAAMNALEAGSGWLHSGPVIVFFNFSNFKKIYLQLGYFLKKLLFAISFSLNLLKFAENNHFQVI